jgi:gluconokinase
MAAHPATHIIVVMGVTGSGKTTVARGISSAMGWLFREGDKFHSPENVAKMAAGVPLDDEDRWPWLKAIGAWIDDRVAAGSSAVVTCSALKRTYRDLLCDGRPEVRFCELDAVESVIAERVAARQGHYMPPSLVPSQLAALEPLAPDEPGVHVSTQRTPEQTIAEALSALGLAPGG